jgi:hypothetical protein
LPCDPPVGGHSRNGGIISCFHRAVCDCERPLAPPPISATKSRRSTARYLRCLRPRGIARLAAAGIAALAFRNYGFTFARLCDTMVRRAVSQGDAARSIRASHLQARAHEAEWSRWRGRFYTLACNTSAATSDGASCRDAAIHHHYPHRFPLGGRRLHPCYGRHVGGYAGVSARRLLPT